MVYGDYVYLCRNNGILSCHDAKSGERIYRERLARGNTGFTASAVAGDGKIYYTSEVGDVVVVKAGAEHQVLATNPLDEIAMATPAISEGVLYFRTTGHLVAVAAGPVPSGRIITLEILGSRRLQPRVEGCSGSANRESARRRAAAHARSLRLRRHPARRELRPPTSHESSAAVAGSSSPDREIHQLDGETVRVVDDESFGAGTAVTRPRAHESARGASSAALQRASHGTRRPLSRVDSCTWSRA